MLKQWLSFMLEAAETSVPAVSVDGDRMTGKEVAEEYDPKDFDLRSYDPKFEPCFHLFLISAGKDLSIVALFEPLYRLQSQGTSRY